MKNLKFILSAMLIAFAPPISAANNLSMDGNAIRSINIDGDVNLIPDGVGQVRTSKQLAVGVRAVDSAMFSVTSISQGAICAPVMSTTQRDAISSPAKGLQIFNDTTSAINFYNGSAWSAVGGGGSGTVTSVGTGTGLTGGPVITTGTISLANTAVSAGSYTNTSLTVDAQGRITSASNGSGGSGTVTSVATGTGLTGGPVTTTGTISLNDTAITPGSYTFANFTVDQQGRLTTASSSATPAVVALSNLAATTAINSNFTVNKNSSWTLKTNDRSTQTVDVFLKSGDSSNDATGSMNIETGASVNSATGTIFEKTGAITAATSGTTGTIFRQTGANAGATTTGGTGDVLDLTGTVSSVTAGLSTSTGGFTRKTGNHAGFGSTGFILDQTGNVETFDGIDGANSSGSISHITGNSGGGSGEILNQTGTSDNNFSGNITNKTGDSTAVGAGSGGLTNGTGDAPNGATGEFTNFTGLGETTGSYTVFTGQATAGNSGSILMSSGPATGTRGSFLLDVFRFVIPTDYFAVGVTGNQSSEKMSGTVNLAAASSSVTVTNTQVALNSVVLAIAKTNDATCFVKSVVNSVGSFVINMTAACTAETAVGWFVFASDDLPL